MVLPATVKLEKKKEKKRKQAAVRNVSVYFCVQSITGK